MKNIICDHANSCQLNDVNYCPASILHDHTSVDEHKPFICKYVDAEVKCVDIKDAPKNILINKNIHSLVKYIEEMNDGSWKSKQTLSEIKLAKEFFQKFCSDNFMEVLHLLIEEHKKVAEMEGCGRDCEICEKINDIVSLQKNI